MADQMPKDEADGGALRSLPYVCFVSGRVRGATLYAKLLSALGNADPDVDKEMVA